MFHVELRQFPHQGRSFNLDREQLEQRILGPWLRGELVEVQDRRWAPHKAKLTIYESRALEIEEIGLGRGWANVTRIGTEVTRQLLAQAHSRAHTRHRGAQAGPGGEGGPVTADHGRPTRGCGRGARRRCAIRRVAAAPGGRAHAGGRRGALGHHARDQPVTLPLGTEQIAVHLDETGQVVNVVIELWNEQRGRPPELVLQPG